MEKNIFVQFLIAVICLCSTFVFALLDKNLYVTCFGFFCSCMLLFSVITALVQNRTQAEKLKTVKLKFSAATCDEIKKIKQLFGASSADEAVSWSIQLSSYILREVKDDEFKIVKADGATRRFMLKRRMN